MAVTRTRDELATEAFALLMGLAPGDEPDADSLAYVKSQINPLIYMLVAEGTGLDVWVADYDEIPEEIFIPLVSLLANVCGPRVASTPRNDAAWDRDIEELRKITGYKLRLSQLVVDRPRGLGGGSQW